jgi:hypothetical protein
MNLEDLNKAKQERVIKIRELDKEICDKMAEIDKLNTIKQEIENENEEIKKYQNRTKIKNNESLIKEIKENKAEIVKLNNVRGEIVKDLKALKEQRKNNERENKNAMTTKNKIISDSIKLEAGIEKLKTDKNIIVKEIDQNYKAELSKKNKLIKSKRHFVKRLNNKDKELKKTSGDLKRLQSILSEKSRLLEEKDARLKNYALMLKNAKKVVRVEKEQIASIRGIIRGQKRKAGANLESIKKIESGKKLNLEKQLKLTEILGNKEKMLNAEIEIQNKRKKFLEEETLRLKQFEIKLLDDRSALQQAWTELEAKQRGR